MFAFRTTRSNARAWSGEFPIGDPHGGPASGRKEDIGSVLSAVSGPIVSGLFGSSAANTQASAAQSAADTSSAASRYATDVAEAARRQTREDWAPWREAGANALQQLVAGMGSNGTNGALTRSFGVSDVQADPGYQFRLQQGQQALDRAAAAGGRLYSGRAQKDMMNYNQGQAAQGYQDAYNRFQSNQTNQYNRLASIAGLGQTANNALQQAGNNYANNVGNSAVTAAGNAGTAQLVGGMGRASAYQGIGNSLGQALGGYRFNTGSGSGGGSSWNGWGGSALYSDASNLWE